MLVLPDGLMSQRSGALVADKVVLDVTDFMQRCR